MRVGPPRLLRVLSHERRGPASVLPGHLRRLPRPSGPGRTVAAIAALNVVVTRPTSEIEVRLAPTRSAG